jgi:hypothetical protein
MDLARRRLLATTDTVRGHLVHVYRSSDAAKPGRRCLARRKWSLRRRQSLRPGRAVSPDYSDSAGTRLLMATFSHRLRRQASADAWRNTPLTVTATVRFRAAGSG